MNISSYEDLLTAASAQADPQRLLFVFAKAGLPGEYTKEQAERFKANEGGELSPIMCVDKLPSELDDFASLVEESRHTGVDWDIVFVASMATQAETEAHADEAELPLKKMVDDIHEGKIGKFLAFKRDGTLVKLQAS